MALLVATSLMSAAHAVAREPSVDPADRLWTTSGDATGLHVLVAEAKTGYQWRTVASLSQPGIDTDMWIGNACVTASGTRAVVVYAPRTFTNREQLFSRGGYTAVVNLLTGAVKKLRIRTTLAYFNPGCGTDERAALTQGGEDKGKTRVLTVDAASGTLSKRVELPGQATSAVPAKDGMIVAGLGRLEKVGLNGKRTRVAKTQGVAYRLRPDADGGVVFQEGIGATSSVRRLSRQGAVSTLATGKLGELGTEAGAEGKVFITGRTGQIGTLPGPVRKLEVPVDAEVSTEGQAAITAQKTDAVVPGPTATRPQRVHLSISNLRTGKPLTATVDPGARVTPRSAPTPDAGAPCSVERNDPRVQVYQPSPRQVEWAADLAIYGKLMTVRPQNWKGNTIPSYQPQGLDKFPPITLAKAETKHVPAQILLGVMGQESNLWQAKRHVLPGQTGNPLVGNYYGIDYYNDDPGDDWTIDWDKADCGYGVGQVTDGMRKPGMPHPKNPNDKPLYYASQIAIATDYAANVAASLQILQKKWNQLQGVNMTLHNNDPSKIENWFYALWAYNSGYHVPGEAGANGAYGLGWGNNPMNPKYPADRLPFGKNPHDFAVPQHWPYPEKVIGFASNPPSGPEAPGMDVPFFRAASWPGGDVLGPVNRDAAKPPITQFCDDSSLCYPDRPAVKPNAPEVDGEPFGPCYHTNTAGQYDLKCWYHMSASWKANCAASCGREFVRFDYIDYPNEEPVRRDKATGERIETPSYPPRCVNGGLPVDFLMVDDVANDVPPISQANCNPAPSSGTFDLDFGPGTNGKVPAKVDLHQVGGGYGAHFWWTETKQFNPTGDHQLRISGTWTLNQKLTTPSRVYVHVTDHLAKAEVKYEVETAYGTAVRTVNQANAVGFAPGPDGKAQSVTSGNRWVYIGGFIFSKNVNPRVRMTNLTSGSAAQPVAFDAIAFAPLLANESPDDLVNRLVYNNSGRCLVIKDDSDVDGAPAIHQPCRTGWTDNWIFKYQKSGTNPDNGIQTDWHRIINRVNGKCLGVEKSNKSTDFTPVVLVDCARTDYENLWDLEGRDSTGGPTRQIVLYGSPRMGMIVVEGEANPEPVRIQRAVPAGRVPPEHFLWKLE